MAGGRGSRGRPRPRATAAAPPVRLTLDLRRLAPSPRSLLVGFLILLCALGAYALARTSSAFHVTGVAVTGAPADVRADVRRALAGVRGQSLLELDLRELRAAVVAVPSVAAVSFDRGFPHTLNVAVVPERPVAVARRGAGAWLVAASGRVIGRLEARGSALPRIWLTRAVALAPGARLSGAPLQAARAVAPLDGVRLPRVAAVRASQSELTLVLRSGAEIRLGDASDRLLKLTIATRILPSVPADGYVDVSVPERPVAGSTLESQVEVETTVATGT